MKQSLSAKQVRGTRSYILLSGGDVVNYSLVRFLTPFYIGIIVAVIGIVFIFIGDYEDVLYCSGTKKNFYNLGYLYNLSWSASMVVVFPVMTGLIIYYYQSLPQFVDRLFLPDHDPKMKMEFETQLRDWFNSRFFVVFILTFGLAIQWLYFKDLQDSSTWVWVNCIPPLERPGNVQWRKMTMLGWCAAVMQMTFTFIFLLFLFRAIAFSVALKELLERDDYDNVPIPFHPDGTSGYGFFRERIFLTIFILTLLGVYVALYMFDKLNQESNLSLAVTFLFISFYLLLGGTIVASSFYAAHIQMQRAKQKLLDPIGRSIKQHLEKIGRIDISKLDKEELEVVTRLKALYKELNQQIPEWPLNIRSSADVMQGFVIPMVPAVMALVGRLIK